MAGDINASPDGLSILQGEEVIIPYQKPLPEILDRLMEEKKGLQEETALYFGGIRVTFKQLQQRSEQLARKLCRRLENDIGAGHIMKPTREHHVIAIHVPPGDHLVVTLFAVLRTGAAYCPLEPSFPASRISYILGDANPLCVLTLGNRKFLNQAIKDHPNVPVYDVKELAEYKMGKSEGMAESRTIGDGNLQFVLYTSGSTGVPKGVKLLLSSVLNRLFWQWKTFPYGETEVGSFKTSLTFVDHVPEIFGPLLQGIPLCIMPKPAVKDPVAFVTYLEAYQVTRLVMVPSLLRMLLAFFEVESKRFPQKLRLPDVKVWVCSGEALPESLLRKFFEYYSKPGLEHPVTFCNFYGATEDMGDVTYSYFRNISDVDRTVQGNNVPIGIPVFNTRAYLLSGNLSAVPLGQVGELYVTGACLAQGYIGNRPDHKGAFIRNPCHTSNCDRFPKYDVLYRTGDFAKIQKGALVFEGRCDAQVKVRGQKVNMSEIERIAEAISGLEKPVVICYNQNEPTQEIVLFYTGKEKVNEKQIIAEFKNHLPDFMVPKMFHVRNYPLLTNSKIDRKGLILIYKDKTPDDRETTSLRRNDVSLHKDKELNASIIRKVTSDVLQIPDHLVTLSANFFEIGGNSVLAALLKAKLRELDIDVDIADIIDSEMLVDIVNSASPLGSDRRPFTDVCELNDHGYRLVPLHQYDHPDALIHIVADSFTLKEVLSLSLNVPKSSLLKFIGGFLAPSLREELSFVILDSDERLLGMYANLDIGTPELLDLDIVPPVNVIADLLESMEREFKAILHGKGKFMENVLGATDLSLNFKENLTVMLALEKQTLLVAKSRGFQGVITANTSTVTQELCENLGYRTVKVLRLNEFQMEDGTRPCGHVPDDVIIKTQLIVLDQSLDLTPITFLD